MTNARQNVTACWIACLVLALGVASDRESQFRQQAQRLDLKVMTLEITNNPEVIPRMNTWRNETRAKAEQWEAVVLRLSLAAAIAAVALTATGLTWLILGGFSMFAAANAGHFAAQAMGVI